MRDMTARTIYGSVDLAPLLRGLNGETAAPVPSWERQAAIAALTDMGIPIPQIAVLVHMNFTQTAAAVREYERVRHSRQVIENAVVGHAIWIARWQHKERARIKSANAKARTKRLAERMEEEGRWFHPRAPHGTNTGYNAYGCRCEGCRGAHSRVQRERRAAA